MIVLFETGSVVKNNFSYTKRLKVTSYLVKLSPKICFICLMSFFMKKVFLTNYSRRNIRINAFLK